MKKKLFTALLIILALVISLYTYLYQTSSISAKGYISVSLYQTPHPDLSPGDEVVEQRTRASKTHWLGGNKYSLDATIGSVHYQDEVGDWQNIEADIHSSPKPNWDWEVTKGHWQLLVAEDTTVAAGKDGHWIGFKYEGVGYLDVATKDYVILQDRQEVTPVVHDNTITWEGIFYSANLTLSYINDTLKEEVHISQITRDWLSNNPPSNYGLSNQTSYLVIFCEVDWKDAYPAEDQWGISIDWSQEQEFQLNKIFFKHPTKDYMVSALPVDYAEHEDVSPNNWVPIRKRFWEQDDKNYLLFGAKLLDLNQYPTGNIVFDPTIDEQVGAGGDDGEIDDAVFNSNGDDCGVGDWYGVVSHSFHRWTGVTISGTIDVSYIEVDLYGSGWTVSNLRKVRAVDEDNPAAPTSAAEFLADAASLTTAGVDWDTTWVDDPQWNQSPSLNTVFQELVDSYTIINEAVMTQIRDDGAPTYNFQSSISYDYQANLGAKLHIEYTAAGACSPDIANSPTTYGFGVLAESASANTGLNYFTLINSSGGSVNMTIQATDMVGGNTWTCSDNGGAGNMIVGFKAGLNGASYNVTVKKSAPYNLLTSGLADSANVQWGLQIFAPSNYTDGVGKSGNITVTAACE